MCQPIDLPTAKLRVCEKRKNGFVPLKVLAGQAYAKGSALVSMSMNDVRQQ